MVSRFAKPVPVLCMVSNIVLNYIFDLHHHRITTWNNSILNPFAIQQYSDAVSRVLPLTTVLGLWMELSTRFAGRGNTNGLFITGTRGYIPSNFRLLLFLMGLLDICSVLWVRRVIPIVSFVFGFKSPVLA